MTGRRLAATVFLAMLVGAGCSSSKTQRVEGAWGKEGDGFQAMLVSPASLVSGGEKIALHVRVRNLMGEIADFASGHDLTLKVSHGDKDIGDDVDYVTLAPQAIKLAPGQEMDFPLRQYATGVDAKLCKGRGLYRFRGKLGKLELPPIEVRVE